MIRGTVTKALDAVIRLTIVGSRGRKRVVEAVIDTGFNGYLSLPSAVIEGLKLPWKRRGRAELGDGRPTLFDVFDASVVWDDQQRTIPVDEAETIPLVGMALLKGFELRMQVTIGGEVVIRNVHE